MASRVRVFDNKGNWLDELESVATVRSWVLNDYGQCQFTLGTADPKCTLRNLQFGNLVYIEHIPSTYTDGNNVVQTRGKLPDWVGIIVTPRIWGINTVEVTVYSAEYILLNRSMPDDTVTDSAGGIFTELLNDANDDADQFDAIEILPGNIWTGGAEYTEVLKLSAHEHAQNVANTYGNNFDVTASIDGNGKLALWGNYYEMKGVNTWFTLSDGDNGNIEFLDRILEEQGTLCNDVIGIGANVSTKKASTGHGHKKGRAKSPHIRLSTEDYDTDSINKYGLFRSNQTYNVSGLGAIHDANMSYLDEHSNPTMTFHINALDNLKTFNNLATGNVLQLQLSKTGFFGGSQIGFQDFVRIDGLQYDDAQNKCELIKHVYRMPKNHSGIQIPIGS